jgi:cell division protein FtsQ
MQRRRKKSIVSRARSLWIVGLFVFAALAYGVYAFVSAPNLRVGPVDVQIDGKTVTKDAVLAAARIDPNANAWLLDTGAIEARVAAIPYVATARVTRRPPAAVTLEVAERTPLACVAARGRTLTIDATLRILEARCTRPGLVRIDLGDLDAGEPGTAIADPSLGALVADIATLAAAHVSVVSLHRDRFGGLVAVDPAGIELRFGDETDLAKKAALVGPVRAALAKGRSIRAVDLRAPGTPTVEFR